MESCLRSVIIRVWSSVRGDSCLSFTGSDFEIFTLSPWKRAERLCQRKKNRLEPSGSTSRVKIQAVLLKSV